MSDKLECPYCHALVRKPDECYEADTLHEMECEECGKIFGFEIEYIRHYTECILPCKNGEPHSWKPIHGAPAEYFIDVVRCEYCNEESNRKFVKLQEVGKKLKVKYCNGTYYNTQETRNKLAIDFLNELGEDFEAYCNLENNPANLIDNNGIEIRLIYNRKSPGEFNYADVGWSLNDSI